MGDSSTSANIHDGEPSLIELPHKPGARLAYKTHSLFVDRAATYGAGDLDRFCEWNDVADEGMGRQHHIHPRTQSSATRDLPPYSILTYDRYGQGQTTDRDPGDDPLADPSHGHDLMSSVTDLHHLVAAITTKRHLESSPVMLVGHSIGVPLARLYASTFPRTISALLLLDSNMANSDFVSLIPDPDAPGFSPSTLPADLTAADPQQSPAPTWPRCSTPPLAHARGLSRKNLATLLPRSNSPKLYAPTKLLRWIPVDAVASGGPFVTVVSHGAAAFSEEGFRMQSTPRAINDVYVTPAWWEYNAGQCELTNSERARGPLEAVGAGHFVQRDRPDLVGEEVVMFTTED